MKKKILLGLVLLIVLSAGVYGLREPFGLVDNRPNIIIILTDDQGYADVGFNGCQDIATPNMDRIAANGVVFSNGYVSHPVCGPSRAGLMTGRYQDRFGYGRNPLFAPRDINQGVPLDQELLSEALQGVGYNTMAIGKWHLGAHPKQHPLEQGFDEHFGFLGGGHHYFPRMWTIPDMRSVCREEASYKTRLLHNGERVEEKRYLTDALSREAVRFVRKERDEPFFLYLAYNAPHVPLEASRRWLDRVPHIEERKRKIYAAMVTAVDHGIGTVLDALDDMNLTDNTIVIFLSDNGGPEQKNASDNGLLREGKGSLFDGGVRVPFAMQWPNMIDPGQVYEKPVISLDLFAIASEYGRFTPEHQIDGVNLIPYLNGNSSAYPHEFLFWRNFDFNRLAVRHKELKLTEEEDDSGLYRIDEDPTERHSTDDPVRYHQLKNAFQEWNDLLMDPVFLGLYSKRRYDRLHPDRFDHAGSFLIE